MCTNKNMCYNIIQKEVHNMEKVETHKNWEFICYPESLQEYWIDILKGMKYRGFISPLHDKDIDEDGKLKKPHYHVIIQLSNKRPNDKYIINSIIKPISLPDKANEHAEFVRDMISSVRYLVHKDNPDKYQYKIEDIICLGGTDSSKYFKAVYDDTIYDRVEDIIFSYPDEITSLRRLIQYCRQFNKKDELYCIRNNTYYFMQLIKENYMFLYNRVDE